MIIGVSGKIGSGKNTVATIIQGSTMSLDIDMIIHQVQINKPFDKSSGFEQKSFAGKLKQIASLLTGIPLYDFELQDFKKTLLRKEWGTVRQNPLNAIPVFEDVQFNELMSVREFLQKLGTEAMRDGLHENVWVNALFADYKPPKMSEYNPSNWIITDMRFPNEMEAVKEKNGITIRVVRPQIETANFKPQHASETSLDDAKFDYTIINDAGIPELIEKVRQILITEKII